MARDSELLNRIKVLEQKVQVLEGALQHRGVMPPPLPQVPPVTAPAVASGQRPKSVAASVQDRGLASRVTSSSDLLGVLGIVFFVLAAAFLVKLAVDAGWLTPERRFAGGMLGGMALVAAGFGLGRRDKAYASLLPAGGAAVLYMNAYAGHLFYGLYDALPTVGVLAAVTALTLVLYLRWRENAYVVVALFGCYLVPLLVPAVRDEGWMTIYFVVWDVVFAVLAGLSRQRWVLLFAGYMALGVFAASHADLGLFGGNLGMGGLPSDLSLAPAAGGPAAQFFFQAVQMALFLAATVFFSVGWKQPMTKEESWVSLPLLLFFYGLEFGLLRRIDVDAAPWIGLAWAAVVLVVAWASGRTLKGGLAALGMVRAYAAVIVFHAGYLVLLPRAVSPWLGILLATGAVVAWRRGLREPAWIVLALVVAGLEALRAVFAWPLDPMSADFALWGPNLGFALLLLGCGLAADESWLPSASLLLFAFAHLQALLGFYRLFGTQNLGAGLTLSVAWSGYGLVLVLAGAAMKNVGLARSAVVLLLLTSVKALLIDTSSADTGVRVFCYLGLGVLLYLSGWLLRRIGSWDTTPAQSRSSAAGRTR
jgi:hypothetical protein